jgi:hypothetical protein
VNVNAQTKVMLPFGEKKPAVISGEFTSPVLVNGVLAIVPDLAEPPHQQLFNCKVAWACFLASVLFSDDYKYFWCSLPRPLPCLLRENDL